MLREPSLLRAISLLVGPMVRISEFGGGVPLRGFIYHALRRSLAIPLRNLREMVGSVPIVRSLSLRFMRVPRYSGSSPGSFGLVAELPLQIVPLLHFSHQFLELGISFALFFSGQLLELVAVSFHPLYVVASLCEPTSVSKWGKKRLYRCRK